MALGHPLGSTGARLHHDAAAHARGRGQGDRPRHDVLRRRAGHRHADPARLSHGHSHGLVDPSITRSREGVRAVSASLAVLLATAVAQAVIFAATGSVALLADLIHNVGDALTAIPLGAAFLLRSPRRSARGLLRRRRDLHQRGRGRHRGGGPLIHPRDARPPRGAGAAGRHRLRRQRGRGADPAARRAAARQPGADRRRQPRPRRRLREPRGRRAARPSSRSA